MQRIAKIVETKINIDGTRYALSVRIFHGIVRCVRLGSTNDSNLYALSLSHLIQDNVRHIYFEREVFLEARRLQFTLHHCDGIFKNCNFHEHIEFL